MGQRGWDQTGQGQGHVDGRCEGSKACVISGFRHHVDETCALLTGYAACSGNPLPTLRTTYRSLLQGSDRLSRSVSKEPLHAA